MSGAPISRPRSSFPGDKVVTPTGFEPVAY